MAIAIHSTTTYHTAGTTHTIPCNLSSTQYRYCVVLLTNLWQGYTSVTCGGTEMDMYEWVNDGGCNAGIWGLKAHATGMQDIVVTFANSCYPVITVLSLRNVDQTTPIRNSNHSAGTGPTNPSRQITSAIGDLVVDTLSWIGDSAYWQMTADAGQTDIHHYRYPANYDAGAMSTKPGEASYTIMSWTVAPTWYADLWSLAAAAIAPSAAEDNGRRRIFIT